MPSEEPRVIVEPNMEQLTHVVATMFESILCETISRNGVCRVALAGGTTPRALYAQLAANVVKGEVPWKNVLFFFGDERDVPHDNIESNYAMAQRTLLDHLPIDPNNIYPMPADREDLAQGAEQYEQTIRQSVPAGSDGVPGFDVILLGVGGDGHTASLFPGNDAVKEKEKLVVAPFVPVLGRRRMTFTLPLINAAKCVILLVSGDDKAQVMTDILGANEEARNRLPAGMVRPNGLLVYALDASAAKYSTYAMK